MLRFLACVALVLLCVRSGGADTFLYATAGSQRRIHGFRVKGDGSLDPDPIIQINTAGRHPKRLITNKCLVYSAESDRVEVFRVGTGGALTLVGATRKSDKMKAHDIVLAEDGNTLYVPFLKQNLIAAYPLGADGAPSADPLLQDGVTAGGPTSCAYGPKGTGGAGWEDLVVANGKLYATATNHVNVYGLDELGRIVGTAEILTDTNGDGTINDKDTLTCPFWSPTPIGPEGCVEPGETRPDPTCPLSTRNRIHGALGITVDGTSLVVGERFLNRLQGFTLQSDGNFPPFGADPAQPTKKEKKAERKTRKKNRTEELVRFIGLTFVRPSTTEPVIYAAAPKGFIDAFRMRDDGTLPKRESSSTMKQVASTPTRTIVGQPTGGAKPVLYVASGEFDRVQAFRLSDQSMVGQNEGPFSETHELTGSFPNDVVLVDTANCD